MNFSSSEDDSKVSAKDSYGSKESFATEDVENTEKQVQPALLFLIFFLECPSKWLFFFFVFVAIMLFKTLLLAKVVQIIKIRRDD